MNRHTLLAPYKPTQSRIKNTMYSVVVLFLCFVLLTACSGTEKYLTMDDISAYCDGQKVLEPTETDDNKISFNQWEYYEVSNKPFETKQGIKIGDPVDILVKKYGNMNSWVEDSDEGSQPKTRNTKKPERYTLNQYKRKSKLPQNGMILISTLYFEGKPFEYYEAPPPPEEGKAIEQYYIIFDIKDGMINMIFTFYRPNIYSFYQDTE